MVELIFCAVTSTAIEDQVAPWRTARGCLQHHEWLRRGALCTMNTVYRYALHHEGLRTVTFNTMNGSLQHLGWLHIVILRTMEHYVELWSPPSMALRTFLSAPEGFPNATFGAVKTCIESPSTQWNLQYHYTLRTVNSQHYKKCLVVLNCIKYALAAWGLVAGEVCAFLSFRLLWTSCCGSRQRLTTVISASPDKL